MANILEYTLTLKDFVSAKLQKIGVTNDAMLDKFGELQATQAKVTKAFAQMGTSVQTLQQKIALLKAERDLLPIENLSAIRKYNSEIKKLERSITKLQTLNGSKIKTWFSEALNSLLGIATNPLILAGAGIGMSIQKGMEADLQQANITTLLRGDVEKAKALYAQLSDYGVKTPYDKAGLIEAQKTMMSFGLSSEFAFGKLKNIVDYAHTPDALENVLKTINDIRTHNETLTTVVGCGGKRDKGNRPIMADIATTLSDNVILTSDNPRNEEPEAILSEMEQGVQAQHFHKVQTITDRRQAIQSVCKNAQKGDIILIAGKGHETYQEIKGVRHHFDDFEIVREFLELYKK